MNTTPGLGHNLPPNDAELLRDQLKETNDDLLGRHSELLASIDRAPAIIEDDETARRMTDLIKMVTSCSKSLDGKRIEAKEPYLTLGRAVDGFFNPLIDQLKRGKTKAEIILGTWLRKKEAEERRVREEAAQAARDESERLAREAQEAEAAQMPKLAEQRISEAAVVEKQAIQAERSAEERPAKLAAVHGDYGSRSSLRSFKVAKIDERAILDLEALRPHFSEAHIQIALNSWMAANWKDDKNPPSLRGASFTLESRAQVR